jgi:DNA-binding transcriptional MerR regulator
MFSIGDFAGLGRVSVRMLRHYDAIGLIRPATVDPASGYRFYRADQLGRLNRVIALKDLGFTLEQVRSIVNDEVDVEQLQGMLRLRRAELDAQIAADTARLNAVGVRLRMIEREGHMPTEDVVIKPLEAVRVAALGTKVNAYVSAEIGPAIQPLFGELISRLAAANITPVGPAVAFYDGTDAGNDQISVHAGMPVNVEPNPSYGFEVIDLPAAEAAATLIHHGSMDTVEASYQTLAQWIEAHGYQVTHHSREITLEYSDDQNKWVTELQMVVQKA